MAGDQNSYSIRNKTDRSFDSEQQSNMTSELCCSHTLPDCNRTNNTNHGIHSSQANFLLSIFDHILSAFLIGPAVIGLWRGVWGLIDLYGLPFSHWITFLIGFGLHLIFTLFRNDLHEKFTEYWRHSDPIRRAGYKFVKLMYTLIFCNACIMHWHGGWSIIDSHLGNNPWSVSGVTCMFLSTLVILKTCRSLLAPPYIITVDLPDRIFNFSTRYRSVSQRFYYYFIMMTIILSSSSFSSLNC